MLMYDDIDWYLNKVCALIGAVLVTDSSKNDQALPRVHNNINTVIVIVQKYNEIVCVS